MPRDKWNFAIGTTSRVPNQPGWHYLMLDVDRELIPVKIGSLPGLIPQRTKSGWHFFTPIKMALSPMLTIALDLGADPVWCSIAAKRGYAFLADKSPVELPWPVERMVIGK